MECGSAHITSGVKQGNSLLSLLFSVYFSSLTVVLFGGFLWSLINVNLHLRTDSKIGLDTTSIYSKLPDFT